MRGDMIIVYKLLNGNEPSLEHLFEIDKSLITRGHNLKLKYHPLKQQCVSMFSIIVL